MNNKNTKPVLDPQFSIGNCVTHSRYKFRAVVIDVDINFQGAESMLQQATVDAHPDSDHNHPDQPWYHLLIHGGNDVTYAPESLLHNDISNEPILHPMVKKFFKKTKKRGRYLPAKPMH